jgi:hypothetical protein
LRVISVETLAGLVELSAFHFSRVFKQTTGLSPLQFVTRGMSSQHSRLSAFQRFENARALSHKSSAGSSASRRRIDDSAQKCRDSQTDSTSTRSICVTVGEEIGTLSDANANHRSSVVEEIQRRLGCV